MNEQQLSLEDAETLSNISEIERTTTTVKEKITFVEPMRRCTKCGELKPIDEFYGCGVHGNKWKRRICKNCWYAKSKKYNEENHTHILELRADWRDTHRDEINQKMREWRKGRDRRVENFLYRKRVRNLRNPSIPGYLYGTGICMICGYLYPLVLINHHVVPWDNEYVLSLCANCHRKYHSGAGETHMKLVLNAIENSKFLWSDIDGEDIRIESEREELQEESPLVEVLVG